MNVYRKKPMAVRAFQMTKERRWNNQDWPQWLSKAWNAPHGEGAMWPNPDAEVHSGQESAERLVIGTLEGVQEISWGDWIIKGVKGKLYLCKPDIFGRSYELVTKKTKTASSSSDEPVVKRIIGGECPRGDHKNFSGTHCHSAVSLDLSSGRSVVFEKGARWPKEWRSENL